MSDGKFNILHQMWGLYGDQPNFHVKIVKSDNPDDLYRPTLYLVLYTRGEPRSAEQFAFANLLACLPDILRALINAESALFYAKTEGTFDRAETKTDIEKAHAAIRVLVAILPKILFQ